MQLYHQHYPCKQNSQAPVVIIPGLFGSTNNWRSFARALCVSIEVYVIDQRNHGRSPHSPTQSYFDMVDDLLSFLDFHGLHKVTLCGHSMGGKTAMLFSLLHPERVAQLVVLDIAPVTYGHSHAPFLDELLKINLTTLDSRGAADRALQSTIPDSATRLFLLQSLTGSPGQYSWRINLTVLAEYMPSIVSFPELEPSVSSSLVASVFIYAANSDYLADEYRSTIEKYFSEVSYVKIDNAGHWLHVEQPAAVLAAVQGFLNL